MSKKIEVRSSGVPFGGTRDRNDSVAPRVTDVLFGRGGGGRYHHGTRAYRSLVKRNQTEYCTCSERQKRLISKSIVLALRNQGRRFLTLSKENAWCEIDIDRAVTKTSQSLREGQPRRRQDLTFKYNAVNQTLQQPNTVSGVHSISAARNKLSTKSVTSTPRQLMKPPGFPGSNQVGWNGTGTTVLDRRPLPCTDFAKARTEPKRDRPETFSAETAVDVHVGVAREDIHAKDEVSPVLSAMYSNAQGSISDAKGTTSALSASQGSLGYLPTDTAAGHQKNVLYSNQASEVFDASFESKVNAIGDFIRNSKPLSSSDHSTMPMSSNPDSKSDSTLRLDPDSDSDNEGHGFFGGLNGLVAPLNSDVLFGRGGGGQYHPGTQAYRYLVRENQPLYCICTERQKRNIAKNIVESLRDQGRRFLSRNKMGTWYDIGNDEAIKKTSQALREGQPYRRLSIVRTEDSTVMDSGKSTTDTPTAHAVLPSIKTAEATVSAEINRNMSEDNLPRHLPPAAPPNCPATAASKAGSLSMMNNKDSPTDLGSISDNYGPRKSTTDEHIAIQALAGLKGGVAATQVSSTNDRVSDQIQALLAGQGKTLARSDPNRINQVLPVSSAQAAVQRLAVASVETGIATGEPKDTDILCYRGACIRNHPGTTEYRDLVRHHQPRYCICSEREKRNIAILIVVKLRAQNRRFLTKGADGIWYDIGDTKAVKKTSQALREGQAERRLLITKARAAALRTQAPNAQSVPDSNHAD